jgi:ketopantoate reductase
MQRTASGEKHDRPLSINQAAHTRKRQRLSAARRRQRTLRKTLTTPSSLTASMLRDIESNARIEADHIIGDLIDRAGVQGTTPIDVRMLRIVHTHLKAYEARRERALH